MRLLVSSIFLIAVISLCNPAFAYKYKVPISPPKVTPMQKEIAQKLLKDGTKYLLNKYYLRAVSTFNKAMKLNPFLLEPYYLKGWALFRLGKIDQASIMWRYYLQVNPNDKRAQFDLKQVFYYLKTSWDALPDVPDYKYAKSYDLSNPDSVIIGGSFQKLKYKLFEKPINIAYISHAGDNLLVTDLTGKKLFIFSPNMYLRHIIKDLYYPTDAETSNNGDIFVVESGKGRVLQYSKQLLKLRELGKKVLLYPQNIFIDEGRNSVWVSDWADNKIKQIDISTGKLVSSFGEKVLFQPTDIVVNKRGFIIVSDYGHHSIKLFNIKGKYIKELLPNVRSRCIRIDKAGNIYILDEISDVIYVLNNHFKNINIFTLPSQINTPTAFTIMPNRDIIISSFTTPHIYRFTPKYPVYLNLPAFINIRKIRSKLPKVKIELTFSIGWVPYYPPLYAGNTVIMEDQQLTDIWGIRRNNKLPRVTHALIIMDKRYKRAVTSLKKQIVKALTVNYKRYLIKDAWIDTGKKKPNPWKSFKHALDLFVPQKTMDSVIIYIGGNLPRAETRTLGEIVLFCRLENLPIYTVGIKTDPYSSTISHISLLTGGEFLPPSFIRNSTLLQSTIINHQKSYTLYYKSYASPIKKRLHWIKATIQYRNIYYAGDGLYTLP